MNKITRVQWCGGLRMMLVIIGMATSLTAQDQWPAAITPHRQDDTMFALTPTTFIRGWNFGLPVRHTSNAMQTNMKHFSFDSMLVNGDSSALTFTGHSLLNETPDAAGTPGFTMYLVPSFRFPYNVTLPNVQPGPITNFHLSSDSYNSPDVAIGFRYEPEMDAHDTTDSFTPDASASQGAAFGFRTRSGLDGVVDHRRLIEAADYLAPTTVLSNVWPQDQLHSWVDQTLTLPRNNDQENTREMMLVVNLRRGDGAPDDITSNQNETVLTIRLPYKLGHNGTPANNIRFTSVANGTSTTRQLNSVDASYWTHRSKVPPSGGRT